MLLTCNVYLGSQSRIHNEFMPLAFGSKSILNSTKSPKFFGLDQNYLEANSIANSVAENKIKYRTLFAKYSNSN